MLLLAAAALGAALPAATLPRTQQCPRTTSHYAVRQGQRAPFRKLKDLPDANAYKAVYRTIGGCEVPVMVKYNVSGGR